MSISTTPGRCSTTLVVCLAATVLMAACSSGRKATTPPTTVPIASTSTDLPVTTVAPTIAPTLPPATTVTTVAETTTTVEPTTTTEAPTTTTIPPGASLTLRGDGIGDATFGNDPDDVTSYMSGILGGPTADSGWFNAASQTCPGTEARFVYWNDLLLVFGDESNISTGRRHFYYWSLGPPAGLDIEPAAITTSKGIGIGSTVADIRKAYPDAVITPGDDVNTPNAQLDDSMFAFLTDSSNTGVVTTLRGGQGCGD